MTNVLYVGADFDFDNTLLRSEITRQQQYVQNSLMVHTIMVLAWSSCELENNLK